MCLLSSIIQRSALFISFSKKAIRKQIEDMISGMSAIDLKWLTRILLKTFKLEIGEKRILKTYHPRAFDLYTQCIQLPEVCKAIQTHEDIKKTPNSLIQIFQPLRPMLCEHGNITQMKLVMHNGYLIENLDILSLFLF